MKAGMRRQKWATAALVCGLGIMTQGAQAQAPLRVLVDQVGYEPGATKIALIRGTADDHPARFVLKEISTGKTVLEGAVSPAGTVDKWGGTYWTADFSALHDKGEYELEVGNTHSSIFTIEPDILEKETLSNVLYYFKGQRSSGLNDAADRHLKDPYGPGTIDGHGGWYDATGDYGIHLSHQNPTSYFNPQQVPLVAWSVLASYRTLEARNAAAHGEDNYSEIDRRLLDEGLFGADFLVRMKRPGGSFYETISAPGAKKLAEDRAIGNPNWKTQIKKTTADSTEHIGTVAGPHAYEASFRAGGGMAIAALALASTMPADGDFPRATYLKTAEEAFDFLAAHNRELLNDGTENILDDYCALLAATDLYQASHDAKYKTAADARATSLMSRLVSNGRYHGYWRADGGTRPFFHPADAGLPVVSLVEYAQIADTPTQAKVRDAVKRSLAFELNITAEENNPFGYARQLVRMGDGTVRTAFFFPHDTEAAPWWQGEDARLASLAAAARLAAPLFADDTAFHAKLEDYAWNQLHWILGRNPYDVSLLEGSGHGDQAYMFFKSWKYRNAPGGIVNGITAAEDNEDGIAFNQGFAVTGKDEDWRWTEQWLPHDAWYLYAVSLPH
ncbi:glycoside hydrolase family 9 protein [Silvibacterium sp.]|uniref:glycoside hydrolase family 9 protein n=1 Tax=Silvibacterium sp. TaxID=1964179 RepID=UPI0039E2B67A